MVRHRGWRYGKQACNQNTSRCSINQKVEARTLNTQMGKNAEQTPYQGETPHSQQGNESYSPSPVIRTRGTNIIMRYHCVFTESGGPVPGRKCRSGPSCSCGFGKRFSVVWRSCASSSGRLGPGGHVPTAPGDTLRDTARPVMPDTTLLPSHWGGACSGVLRPKGHREREARHDG